MYQLYLINQIDCHHLSNLKPLFSFFRKFIHSLPDKGEKITQLISRIEKVPFVEFKIIFSKSFINIMK